MSRAGVAGSFAHTIHPQPVIHGERFTFKPTRNFEFGFSRTGIFAGQGVPFTLHTFEKSFFGTGNGAPGTVNDPGDRRSGMDWTYRVPKLRDWVTFYGDAFADDQISPIAYWDRSAIRGGLFFSHVPRIPKLDLRFEGVYTDLPAGGASQPRIFLLQHPVFQWLHQPGPIAGELDWARRAGCTGMGKLLVQPSQSATV